MWPAMAGCNQFAPWSTVPVYYNLVSERYDPRWPGDRDAALLRGLQSLEAHSLEFEEHVKEMTDRMLAHFDAFDKAISELKPSQELQSDKEGGQKSDEVHSVTAEPSVGNTEGTKEKMQLEVGKKEVACPNKYGGGEGNKAGCTIGGEGGCLVKTGSHEGDGGQDVLLDQHLGQKVELGCGSGGGPSKSTQSWRCDPMIRYCEEGLIDGVNGGVCGEMRQGGFVGRYIDGGGFIDGEGWGSHGGTFLRGGADGSGSGGGPGATTGGEERVKEMESDGGHRVLGSGYLGSKEGVKGRVGSGGREGGGTAVGCGSSGGPGCVVCGTAGGAGRWENGGRDPGWPGGGPDIFIADVTLHRRGGTWWWLQKVGEERSFRRLLSSLEKNPESDSSDVIINFEPHDLTQKVTPYILSKGNYVFSQELHKKKGEDTCFILAPLTTYQVKDLPTKEKEKQNLGSTKRNEIRPTLEFSSYQPKYLPTALKPNPFHFVYSFNPLSVHPPQIANQFDPAHMNPNPFSKSTSFNAHLKTFLLHSKFISESRAILQREMQTNRTGPSNTKPNFP